MKTVVLLLPKKHLFKIFMFMLFLFAAIFLFCREQATSVISFGINSPFKNKVIIIDPGHGGIDGGANTKDCLEKDINLKIAKILAQKLKTQGAKVILTRETDTELSRFFPVISRHKKDLFYRISLVERFQPDAFLSIHANFGRSSSTGAMVFYNQKIPHAECLATGLQNKLNTLMEKHAFQKHQAHTGNYFILRNTSATGAIIEVGFLSNAREREMLKKENYQTAIAEALTQGLESYFSIRGLAESKYKTGNEPAKKSPHNVKKNEIKVFFPSSNSDELCFETTYSVKNAALQEKLKYALITLFKGPKGKNLFSVLNPKTKIRGISIHDGIAYLNFSKELSMIPMGDFYENAAEESIIETASQFEGVVGVKILIEGKEEAVLRDNLALDSVLTPHQAKAKIALVFDDGASGKTQQEILDLNRRITISVLPKRPLSSIVADEAHSRGYEVFLHLPMEADFYQPSSWLGDGAITLKTPIEDVEKTIASDLSTVPFAIGLNNHMGSGITKRAEYAREVLKFAKNHNLIVLDSKTTVETIMPVIAKELGMPILVRDVFLDEINTVSHVKKKIRELAEVAKKNGSAIGIGHIGDGRDSTARAVKEMLPWLENQGIELVYASSLIK